MKSKEHSVTRLLAALPLPLQLHAGFVLSLVHSSALELTLKDSSKSSP